MSASKRPSLAELIEMRRAVPSASEDGPRQSLSDRFILPPFSVLDARQGYWQTRKRAWLAMGIDPTLGRGENILQFSERVNLRKARSINTQSWYSKKIADGEIDGKVENIQDGTSSFDPVLCEMVYRWFTPVGGRVLDPFVGGPMSGIVATHLRRAYTGVDIRPEQVEANRLQCASMCPEDADVEFIVGSAVDADTLCHGEYDLIYSCPPYANLERYSDDPRDLSTMSYDKFLDTYRQAIASSCNILRDNRFACFVVGDVRDRKTGNYRNFVGDTIDAFHDAGLEFYNDAVLVTMVGSLSIRTGRQFSASRKLGKAHQNVLVFLKGDSGRAVAACGEVDTDDFDMPAVRIGAVAMCVKDAVGTIAWDYLGEDEVAVVCLPNLESYLMADVVRGQARASGAALPRVWVGGPHLGSPTGWRRLQEGEDLTYLVHNKPYLSRSVFPDASLPAAQVPAVRRLDD